ncbi:MAG: protein-L-isoaspartate(D-aspartate) O-methyltransferase [Candidatus Latescibacteria bacterium]|nr:protein-L-isoaspartate(D-aspartate) O-methyltransferase [Candidatus Latescibacterota bacterium]
MLQIITPIFVIFVLLGCGGRNAKHKDDYAQTRKTMVKTQIASRGVSDPRVLKAMEKVPRHLFIPKHLIDEAYSDYPLPISEGQTISQPYIVARMTELAQLKGDEKVLEIGTGSGYQAAVLSLLCKEVYTIEIVEKLANFAEQKLKELNYHNVYVRYGDGYLGWTQAQPFDVILITCAPPTLPESLIVQLKNGGRIVAPIGEEYATQILTVFEKIDNKLVKTEHEPVRFVPMKGLIEQDK